MTATRSSLTGPSPRRHPFLRAPRRRLQSRGMPPRGEPAPPGEVPPASALVAVDRLASRCRPHRPGGAATGSGTGRGVPPPLEARPP